MDMETRVRASLVDSKSVGGISTNQKQGATQESVRFVCAPLDYSRRVGLNVAEVLTEGRAAATVLQLPTISSAHTLLSARASL